MAANVVINVKALTGQATSELNKLKRSFADLSTSDGWKNLVTGVGVGAGIGAFNALTGAIRGAGDALADGVRDAAEEEAGLLRLGAALRANVPAWNGNIAAIEATIASRRALAFSDDELRQSFGSIVAATHDVSEAFKVQQTAMDLARFKGISLADASDALIRVEAGQYRALKNLGIVLREGATQTEALAAVQAVAAGQNEAYGKSAAGALFRLDDSIKELKESVGTLLLPALTDLANVLAKMVENRVGIIAAIAAIGAALLAFLVPPLVAAAAAVTASTAGLNLLIAALAAAGISLGAFAIGAASSNQSAVVATRSYSAMSYTIDATRSSLDAATRSWDTNAEAIGANRGVAITATGALGDLGDTQESVFDKALKNLDSYSNRWKGVADDVKAGTAAVRSAIEDLRDAIASETSTTARLAYLGGILYGKELARGLKSKDPDARDAAVGLRTTILAEIDRLTNGMYTAGANAAAALANGVAALVARAAEMNETISPEEIARLQAQAAAYRAIAAELRAAAGGGTNPYTPTVTAAADSTADLVKQAKAAVATLSDLKGMVASLTATMAAGWTPAVLTVAQAQANVTAATERFTAALGKLKVGSAATLSAVTTAFANMKNAALAFYAAQRDARVADLNSAIAAVAANVQAFRDQLDGFRRARQQADLEEAARNARGVYSNALEQEIADLTAANRQKQRTEEETRLKLAVTQARTRKDRAAAAAALEDYYARINLEDLQSQRERERSVEQADQNLLDFQQDQQVASLQSAADYQTQLYQQQITAANAQYDAQVGALGRIAAAVESGLEGVKGIWDTKNKQALAILAGYVDNFKAAGRSLAKAVEDGVTSVGTIYIDVVTRYTTTGTPVGVRSNSIEHRASGGPVTSGRTFWVGERGPELLTMGAGQSGYITPNNAIGGGGQPVIIRLELDGRVVSEVVDRNLFMKYRTSARGAGIA